MTDKGKKGLYLMLISIHGLIRGYNLELGRDADTGGQTIKQESIRATWDCRELFSSWDLFMIPGEKEPEVGNWNNGMQTLRDKPSDRMANGMQGSKDLLNQLLLIFGYSLFSK